MKMEQTECSETLAYKIQAQGNYPEVSIEFTLTSRSVKWQLGSRLRGQISTSEQSMRVCGRQTSQREGFLRVFPSYLSVSIPSALYSHTNLLRTCCILGTADTPLNKLQNMTSI